MVLLPVEVSSVSAVLAEVAKTEHAGKPIYILFTGTDDPETGRSWCGDCCTAEPVIDDAVKNVVEDGVFILCTVGDKPTWKDPNNEFRVCDQLKLKSIPTLMKWGTQKRLEEGDCAQQDLVDMLFE